MNGRVLVTRPRDDAAGISGELEARGFQVQLEPMLSIVVRQGVDLPIAGLQGYLATSANGVRALAANAAPRQLPLWAVGAATAACARDLGFAHVDSADGDVIGLAALVAARADPAKGALLHAAGSAVAGDLAGQLGCRGFDIRRLALYEARTAEAFSPALTTALEAEALDLALFFSPRTAATFVRLAQAAGLSGAVRGIDAFALSLAVAEQLAALPWRAVRTARTPDQAALLAAIDAARGR